MSNKQLDLEHARSLSNVGDLLSYIVEIYGKEVYLKPQQLVGLLADLANLENRLLRLYRRAIIEFNIAQKIYNIVENKDAESILITKLENQFRNNYYLQEDISQLIVDNLLNAIYKPIISTILTISTISTEADGEFIDEFGVKYSRDGRKLIKAPETISNYVVKDGTIVICDEAFYCDGSSLTSLTLPNSVTHLGDKAFRDCKSLKSITLPNSVTHIGARAFSGCGNLESITLPNSVAHIGNSAFWGCKSLESINASEGNTSFISIDGVLYTKDFKSLVYYPEGNKNDSFNIPNSVTHIGDSAFRDCRSLKSINLPNSVTHIGKSAFLWCFSLESLTLPNSVTHIGNSAFRSCSSLESITIPNSVTHIGSNAFENCISLKSLTLPNSVTHIGNSAFVYCKSLESITIPNSVTHIGNSAFWGCRNLESLTLPNSVTHIGDSAFARCFSLESLTLPNSVTHIDNSAFYDCDNLHSINVSPNNKHYISIGGALYTKDSKRLIFKPR